MTEYLVPMIFGFVLVAWGVVAFIARAKLSRNITAGERHLFPFLADNVDPQKAAVGLAVASVLIVLLGVGLVVLSLISVAHAR